MKKLLGIWAFALLSASCASPPDERVEVGVQRDALTPPFSPVTIARVSSVDGNIDVSWPDWEGETNYRLFANESTNPPLLFNGNLLGEGWTQIATPDEDVLTFRHRVDGARSYIACAEDINAPDAGPIVLQCAGISARVKPSSILDGASINDLTYVAVGTTFIDVEWKDSGFLVHSEISISPLPFPGFPSSTVDNQDQAFTFSALRPGTDYTITGCAQSERQTQRGEHTCNSIHVATLPEAPRGIESLRVLPSTSARSQSIRFSDDNSAAFAASSYLVRLFRDGENEVFQEKTINSTGPGQQTHTVTFNGLTPFTAFEAWVIPLNVSGPGTASGIGFTTVAEVVLTSQPLSGTSAMLMFNADAYGDYSIERKTNGTFTELTRIRVAEPAAQRVVLDDMSTSQTIRVTWRFAGRVSSSNELLVARGPTGAPEILTGSFGPQFPFGDTLPLRASATFDPTITDVGKVNAVYVLNVDAYSTGGTRTLATLSTLPFYAGEAESLSGTSQTLVSSPRVCRKVTSSTGVVTLACSAGLGFKTQGLIRVH